MYGPWEIVEWELMPFKDERIADEIWMFFERTRDGNRQKVRFYIGGDGRWYLHRAPNTKFTHPRELKREIRNAYKLLPLIYSTEKENEQNQ